MFQGNLVEDESNVKDALQRRIRHLELGTHRLFRRVGCGEKITNKRNLPRVHQVFLTYSANVATLIAEGTIIVDDSELVEVEDESEDEYVIFCNEENLDFFREL